MTDKELMQADAEYWLGLLNEKEFLSLIGDGAIARVNWLENDWGLYYNQDMECLVLKGEHNWFEIRAWFSLMVAEASATIWESAEGWPFPEVVGVIPE